MAWAIAALLAIGLAVASVAVLRVTRRLIGLTAMLDLERELLDRLAHLFVADAVTDGVLDGARDVRVEPDARLVDDVPEGRIVCGIDVVDAEGRVIGTAAIPAPARN
jgi:hypothetical protein